ncbi:MAG: tetratricopeptide repeat protein [Geminicoccaceae bacterium]|nr:tetratricopeptide repeat protein [Geminicoccaceae bacterium]MCX8101310.1 tetratricopeptide repeat protein [Geminicoccaceae bacterium]MDW8369104.1 tetratricopeptide repeat protein [Geminicoccaceae bacterium]
MTTNSQPKDAGPSAGEALRRWQAGEHAAAEAEARALLDRDPHDLLALLVSAAAALQRGALEEAIPWAERAIAIAPSDHRAHTVRGMAARAAGDLALAEAAYRRALALAPDDPAVAANLGNLLLALGRLEEALSLFARALRADPAAGAARAGLSTARTRLMQRAVVLHNAGESAEAARL